MHPKVSLSTDSERCVCGVSVAQDSEITLGQHANLPLADMI